MYLGLLIATLILLVKGGIIMSASLTQAVLQYQQLLEDTSKENETAQEALFLKLQSMCHVIIYTYPVKVRLLKEEEAAELLLYISPRIKTIIESFTYQGLTFEGYLRRISFLQAYHYIKKRDRAKRKYSYTTYPSEDMESLMFSEPAMQYQLTRNTVDSVDASLNWSEESEASKKVKQKLKKSKTFRKRFLQLILLCSDHLTARHIAFLADYMEMDELKLAQLVTEAFAMTTKKREKDLHVQSVRNKHYLEYQFLKRELSILETFNADPIRIQRLQKRYERSRILFEQRCQEAQKRPNSVTHAALGKQLETPKGTIDSGINALKRLLKEIMDDSK